MRISRTHLLIAPLLALAALPLAGCTTNAATGRSQFNSLSRSQEIQIGSEAMPQLIQQYGGPVPDPYLQQYVSDLGMQLAKHTEADYPTMPWEFTFLNSPVVNAFALPGGKVFITRGLVEDMDNEAQLAGVLGHEIGHVTAQHADDRVTRQLILAGVAIGGSVAASQSDNNAIRYGVPALVSTAGVFALTYDRNEELEADKLGMRYMTRAGYDPIAQMQVMVILANANQSGGAPPEFLSTHPHPKTRINKIEKRLSPGGGLHYTQNNPEYNLYEEQFQDTFLNRLNTLPPMPQPTAIHYTVPTQAITCTCSGAHHHDHNPPSPVASAD